MGKETFRPYKEESRTNWGSTKPLDQGLTLEQIQLGAILRIADSLESIQRSLSALSTAPAVNSAKVFSLNRKIKRLENANKKLKEQRDFYFNQGGKEV
jgi:hypothetical protein